MHKTMKALAVLSVMSSSPALADGHAQLWDMVGIANAPSAMQVIEGASGSIMISSSTDLWDWSNAPEGFPTLVTAECSNAIALTTDGAPFGGVGVCSMMDPDGDLAIFFGEITPQFEYVGALTAASGKYAPYIDQEFVGTVTGMLDSGQQMYHVVPLE